MSSRNLSEDSFGDAESGKMSVFRKPNVEIDGTIL